MTIDEQVTKIAAGVSVWWLLAAVIALQIATMLMIANGIGEPNTVVAEPMYDILGAIYELKDSVESNVFQRY